MIRDTVPLVALPTEVRRLRERRKIWEYVHKNPGSTVNSISEALVYPVSYVRKRVACLVADLKLAPSSFDYSFFNLKSSIMSVNELLVDSTYAVVANRMYRNG